MVCQGSIDGREPGTRKNLSGNRKGAKTITLLKANESTSQLHQGQIALGKFVPADQDPAEVIEPGVQPLDHPASWLFARLLFQAGGQLLGGGWMSMIAVPPVGPRMGRVASPRHLLKQLGIVIAGIQTEMLLDDLWVRTLCDDGIQSGKSADHIVAIGCLQHDGQWQTVTFTQMTPFGPPFAAVHGILSGEPAAERGFDLRPIQTLPLPVQTFQLIILFQACLPEVLEEALLFPQSEAVIDRARGSQFVRHSIPGNASAQQVDDGRKHLAIIVGGSTSLEPRSPLWNQRADAFPQLVADFPGFGSGHAHCSFAFVFVFLSLILSLPFQFPDKFLRVPCPSALMPVYYSTFASSLPHSAFRPSS